MPRNCVGNHTGTWGTDGHCPERKKARQVLYFGGPGRNLRSRQTPLDAAGRREIGGRKGIDLALQVFQVFDAEDFLVQRAPHKTQMCPQLIWWWQDDCGRLRRGHSAGRYGSTNLGARPP
jgi:hypothetical protein